MPDWREYAIIPAVQSWGMFNVCSRSFVRLASCGLADLRQVLQSRLLERIDIGNETTRSRFCFGFATDNIDPEQMLDAAALNSRGECGLYRDWLVTIVARRGKLVTLPTGSANR
jgi:hypothetical protein